MRFANYLTFAMLFVTSCKELGSPATEAAYTADLLHCVEKATTLKESKACRAEVDRKWNIDQDAANQSFGGQ